MDILTLIKDVRAMIAAVKAGDYLAAVTLLLDILRRVVPQPVPSPQPGPIFAASETKKQSMADCSAKSEADLLLDLDNLCTAHQGPTAPVVGGPHPLIEKLLPVLLALLSKWLGF